MRTNRVPKSIRTHEGGKAKRINSYLSLKRSVLSCLLWEKEFYESGENIAKRIQDLVAKTDPLRVSKLAIEARHSMKLRHVPLLIVCAMAKLEPHKKFVSYTLSQVINRPDELTEFLAIYWKDGKKPISNQIKKGLALAFSKFNEYQLAKYNRKTDIKLRDILRLCHPKPTSTVQSNLWKRLIKGELETPDTHEVAISANGADKTREWTRLLEEGKLGAMAILKNLRNMQNNNVSMSLIRKSLETMNTDYVLPYRFISAAKFAPSLEPSLEKAMIQSLNKVDKIKGTTVLLMDVSASMKSKVSDKSDITRMDAGCGLAILLSEICEHVEVFTFSRELVQVPSRKGFALRDAIVSSQQHNATYLGTSISAIYGPKGKDIVIPGHWRGTLRFPCQGLNPDRLIVISDEQSNDKVPDPKGKAYMINVASAKYGVGYGAWTHCDGWSESVVKWIQELEAENF